MKTPTEITVTLEPVGNKTGTPKFRAKYKKHVVEGVGYVVIDLIRQLRVLGFPLETTIHVKNGSTPSFVPMSLSGWLRWGKKLNVIKAEEYEKLTT